MPPGPPPGPPGPPPGPRGSVPLPPGFPPTPPTQPAPGAGSGRSPWWVLLVVLVAVALVAGGAGIALLLTGDDGGDGGASEVVLEPVGSTGENPFMPSVGDDQVGVQPPPQSAGTFPGDTAGLYGGTTNESSCAPDRMVSFLEANPSKAAAWAGVFDIGVSDISSYVDTLTPGVLRADTAVTNHGFSGGGAASKSGGNPAPSTTAGGDQGGVATSFQAVLQAGTAVLVDDTGLPVVKCGCGNPLLPPQRTGSVRYQGTPWSGFDGDRITIVQRASVTIGIFVLVDVVTGDPFGRPTGTNGGQDGPAPEPPASGWTITATPTDDSTTTSGPTTTASGLPADGSYSVTTAGGCALPSFTLTVSGSTVTANLAGQTFSGALGPDGSFSISDATGGISGQFAGDSVSGNVVGTDCTDTFQGSRTG